MKLTEAERIINGIYQKGMLDYESICEQVSSELAKNGCDVSLIVQHILDKAQVIFEDNLEKDIEC